MRAGLVARVRTLLRRRRLDEQLARGLDPDTTADLSLRAAQLSSDSGRADLANGLVEALGDARGPNLGAFMMRTRRRHAAIREAAEDLRPLVLRLRDERPIAVQGAAMAALLLSDRGSPLHRDSAQELQGDGGLSNRSRDPHEQHGAHHFRAEEEVLLPPTDSPARSRRPDASEGRPSAQKLRRGRASRAALE